MWDRTTALDFAAELESALARVGYHVALAGGVLWRGQSEHDLDLVVYPHDSVSSCEDDARRVLERCGMSLTHTVEELQAHWRTKGSTDEKRVDVWRIGDRRVDVLWLR